MSEKACGTCRYFAILPYEKKMGSCERINNEDRGRRKAYIYPSGRNAWLCVKASFVCGEHQPARSRVRRGKVESSASTAQP